MSRRALYKQLISGRTDLRFENPLVFERDQAISLKSTIIIIIIIIIIISVQFIRPYFFSKGLVIKPSQINLPLLLLLLLLLL